MCPLEEIEGLEQLRTLWNGARIHVALANEKIPPDVNTPEDYERVCEFAKKKGEA